MGAFKSLSYSLAEDVRKLQQELDKFQVPVLMTSDPNIQTSLFITNKKDDRN